MLPSLLFNRFTWIAIALTACMGYLGYLHVKISTLENYKAKTELIAAKQVEQNRVDAVARNDISEKISAEYENRIAALNARIERMQHSSGNTMPAVPTAPVQPDAAPAASNEVSSCGADYARTATQLEELQEWVRQQENLKP